MSSLKLSCALLLGAFLIPANAQDLIGVGYGGQTYLVNSYSGSVTPLGTGIFGMNATARDTGGTIWTIHRTTATSNVYRWLTLDPATGATTDVYPAVDIRSMAAGGPGGTLFAIQEFPFTDSLVLFDPATGSLTPVGNTGYSAVQGLAMHNGVLYGWELFRGLVIIDPTTGAGTDPFPGVVGPMYPQTLCSHPDGRLLLAGGTNNKLYQLDVTTGAATLIGPTTGAIDIRGLEPLGTQLITPFGQGCDGVSGLVNLTVTSSTVSNGRITTSGNHEPNALGVAIFGFSTTAYAGQSLPLLLDPQLGTAGCTLYTSIDVPILVFASGGAPAELTYSLSVATGAAGLLLHVQHACFEPVQGGMSWSNAVSIQL